MHIMEGVLPSPWWQLWLGLAFVLIAALYLLRTKSTARGSAKKSHTIFDEHILDDVAIASTLRQVST